MTDLLLPVAAAAPGLLPWDLLAAVLLWGLLTAVAVRWLLRRERRAGTASHDVVGVPSGRGHPVTRTSQAVSR